MVRKKGVKSSAPDRDVSFRFEDEKHQNYVKLGVSFFSSARRDVRSVSLRRNDDGGRRRR